MDKLSEETRTKLRSTHIITSLSSLVSELFQNSLDAGASNIEIGVDCEAWSCWVKDDGMGMTKDDLRVLAVGSEQGRYGTSKAHDLDSLNYVTTLGFRGEALASISDLCCLEISTRSSTSRESWSIILKGGKCLYTGPSVRWRREAPGTVTYVRDAFYSLPIRRQSHPSPSKTYDVLRQEIECYALAFPSVAFSLTMTGDEFTSGAKEKVYKVPRTSSSLSTFRRLFSRALAENIEEIHQEQDDIKIDGFVSLNGAHSKAYQYLYINRHPLAAGDLHKIIDSKFTSSTFGKHALDEVADREYNDARRSPRKAIMRHVYVLNITIPPSRIDNCVDPSKAIVHIQGKETLSSFLGNVIETVLIKHGFLRHRAPRARVRAHSEEPGASPPRKRRKVTRKLRRESSEPCSALYLPPQNSAHDPDATEQAFVWTDPRTGQQFQIDQRTGNSFPLNRRQQETGETGRREIGRRSLALPRALEGAPETPEWIRSALEANDAWNLTSKRIPAIKPIPIPENLNPREGSSGHSCARRAIHDLFTDTSIHRFGAEDLKHARVIQQVDTKFISCLMGSRAGARNDNQEPTLVLIDQHAADERVRVERFLKEICDGFLRYDGQGTGVEVRDLSPPAPILLTKLEAEKLSTSRDIRRAFGMWGIDFDFSVHDKVSGDREEDEGGGESAYLQVYVRCVPEVVATKLLMDNELRQLVKGYIAHLDHTGLFPPRHVLSDKETHPDSSNDSGWLKALRWCPKELLDLINSKACRGAIMFNDPLTRAQCEDLVAKLSRTALPFQCAHGRPSLVPLAKLGPLAGGKAEGERQVEWENLDASG